MINVALSLSRDSPPTSVWCIKMLLAMFQMAGDIYRNGVHRTGVTLLRDDLGGARKLL